MTKFIWGVFHQNQPLITIWNQLILVPVCTYTVQVIDLQQWRWSSPVQSSPYTVKSGMTVLAATILDWNTVQMRTIHVCIIQLQFTNLSNQFQKPLNRTVSLCF